MRAVVVVTWIGGTNGMPDIRLYESIDALRKWAADDQRFLDGISGATGNEFRRFMNQHDDVVCVWSEEVRK